MRNRIFISALLLAIVCCGLGGALPTGLGQDTLNDDLSSLSSTDDVTAEDVEVLRALIPADDEKLAADIQEILNHADLNLNQGETFQKSSEKNEKAKKDASERVEALSQPSLGQAAVDREWSEMTMEALQSLVQEQTDAVNKTRELSEKAAAQLGERITRRQQIREKLPIIEQSRDLLEERLQDAPRDQLIDQARVLEMRSKIQSLTQEKKSLESELARMDAEDQVDYPRLYAETLKQQTSFQQEILTAAQDELGRRRQEIAAEQEQKTRDSRLGEDPVLKPSFEKNLKLAEDNRNAASEISDAEKLLKAKKEELSNLKKQFNDAKSRVKLIGLTGAVGAMLRNQKDQLPSLLSLSQSAAANEQSKEVQFQLYEVKRQLENQNGDTIRDEILKSGLGTASDVEGLADSVKRLNQQRDQLLTAANKNFLAQHELLIELASVNSQLSQLAGQYRGFINERILWIRSNDLLLSSLRIDESDRAALNRNQWAQVWSLLVVDWGRHLWIYLLMSVAVILLLLIKPRMRKAVDDFGAEASRGSCTSFWPTAKSLVLSVVMALIVPMILLFVAWRLLMAVQWSNENVWMVSAFAKALLYTSWFLIPVDILKRFCRKSGLAHKHFNWTNKSVKTIQRNLKWAGPIGSVIVFTVSLIYFLDTRHQNDLVERIVFLLGMGVLVVLLYRCLNPKSGVFRDYLRAHEGSWANQLSTVWFGFLLFVPITLGVLALVGYYYTSLNLAACVFMTFVFGLIVETSRALLMRFILTRRRHAHIELARRRREAKHEELNKEDEDGQGELAAAVVDKSFTDSELLEDFNVDAYATQSRKLIGLSLGVIWFLGLWLIWTDVLPALRALDQYPVWSTAMDATTSSGGDASSVSVDSTTMGGTSVDGLGEEVGTRITIRDLLVFFLIGMITMVLARNLPGLVEMTFLNHLPVEPSVRYASKSIMSYLIVLLGSVLAFRSIQVGWEQVQWLATALTFGLAFGLQEIFANFVAGIILLFERPIRIGDVVTIDEVTGVVTKIRTRATTVSNWDRKEYVIPNKEFITGRVLNWTLSDEVNRIVINVGIAYGSDVELAKRLLLEICEGHPKTIENPSTNVTFEQFADSSLLLTVRTFVPNVNSRLTVIDQLHTEINNSFEKAGIEISFPQMDLHLRGADENLLKQFKP